MYRPCCRGVRPCMWTVLVVLSLNVLYRALLLLEGQGTLARHGFNITIPKLGLSLRKPPTATVPMEFLVEERGYCTAQPDLLAVALIPSRAGNFALRQETRLTWGSAPSLGIPLGRVFLLGRHADREQRRLIRAESAKYHDIVQANYDDTDETSKTLNGVLWLAMNCARVPFTIYASDKILLDVFLLQSFLWEVLEVPEKQGMLFGKLTPYRPPEVDASLGWSFKDLGHFVPEVTEPPIEVYPPYFQEGVWFGRTQSVAKLLGVSGGVPLVRPASLYVTGFLANAAGLHKSPDLFNAWWRSDRLVRTEEIGLVLGWLNETLVPPRSELWQLLKKHHRTTLDALQTDGGKEGGQSSSGKKADVKTTATVVDKLANVARDNQLMVRREVEQSSKKVAKKEKLADRNAAKVLKLVKKLTTNNNKIGMKQNTTVGLKNNKGNSGGAGKVADKNENARFLFRKKQLEDMMRKVSKIHSTQNA